MMLTAVRRGPAYHGCIEVPGLPNQEKPLQYRTCRFPAGRAGGVCGVDEGGRALGASLWWMEAELA